MYRELSRISDALDVLGKYVHKSAPFIQSLESVRAREFLNLELLSQECVRHSMLKTLGHLSQYGCDTSGDVHIPGTVNGYECAFGGHWRDTTSPDHFRRTSNDAMSRRLRAPVPLSAFVTVHD